MPSTLGNTAVKVSIIGSLLSVLGLVTGQALIDYEKEYDFAQGTGANQADDMFSDHRTLGASASESLDMSGSLTDALGNTVSFTKIKALLIKPDAGNVNDVVIGNAGGNDISTIFGAITHTIKVKPGGVFLIVAPDANGYGVTAGTADLLHIANGGSGTGVTYDIIVIGV